jgi:DNA modification methylase
MVINQEHGKKWAMYNGDSCQVVKDIPSDSVGLTVFSPPFSSLYIYSDSEADMGNCKDDEEFFEHFSFLLPELYRITIPGRLCAIHCKDLPLYRGSDGAAGLTDFPGQIIVAMQKAGWTFHSRCTVWKCPVTERERTNNSGLLHKSVMSDSSQIRMGMADYVIVFRKSPIGDDNRSDVPIERPKGFKRFIGDPAQDPRKSDSHPSKFSRKGIGLEQGTAGEIVDRSNIVIWRRYAEPVWWDIDQTDVLNFKIAKDAEDEKHICPLQLGLIRRIVELWSAPGDVVFSPFGGVGSEGVVAIEEGRKYIGIELKESYWRYAVRYLKDAEYAGEGQIDMFEEVAHAG